MDILQRMGMYPVPTQAPKTLGVEFSGTIESFGGEPEKGFKVGDEVFGLAYGGTSSSLSSAMAHFYFLLTSTYRAYSIQHAISNARDVGKRCLLV